MAKAGPVLAFPALLAVRAVLSIIAGADVARNGKRMSAMMVMGVILFAIADERRSNTRMLAIGLGEGYLATVHFRLMSTLNAPLADHAEAVRPVLFLAVGVAVHRYGDDN